MNEKIEQASDGVASTLNAELDPEKVFLALLYGENKPLFNESICNKCGGLGIVAITCCGGTDCGCFGMPHRFDDCDCGVSIPTDKQILEWV